MTRLLTCLVALGCSTLATAAPPRLIVRGDDMGAAHAINEAIIQCHKEGIQTSIEVIVPSPWFPEAARLLAEAENVDVGVHLALSSEWDNVKWRPLTDCPSLRDADGYFLPMIFPNKNYAKRSLAEQDWKIEEIEREFRAQIEQAQKRLPNVSHVSHHMGCASLDPSVQTLAKKLAAEYKLDIDPNELGVKGVSYAGPRGTGEEKIDSFIKMLDSLEDDQTYLFVDHPALDAPEMRAIHHVGYEDVAADRQGVTDCWSDRRVREFIRAKGIKLIGYRDLKP